MTEAQSPTFLRRRWLVGAVAGAAALAGAGLAWRMQAGRTVPTPVAAPPLPTGLDLWQLNFTSPEGASVKMATFRGHPLLLNFWATWCPPCVEELPLINRFFTENAAKGWQVLGLAVDQADPVKRFLDKMPLNFSVALAGMPGIELSKSLGNLTGGLPFTVVIGADGQIAQRKMGKILPQDLQSWAALT